jgi:hypothetical protein
MSLTVCLWFPVIIEDILQHNNDKHMTSWKSVLFVGHTTSSIKLRKTYLWMQTINIQIMSPILSKGNDKRIINLSKPMLAYVPPGLTLRNSIFCPHRVFICFIRISVKATIISIQNTKMLLYTLDRFVQCEVQTKSLNVFQVNLRFYEFSDKLLKYKILVIWYKIVFLVFQHSQ